MDSPGTDATEVDPTEVGTAAASPKAIADAAAQSSQSAQGSEQRASGWATASRQLPTAAEALDGSELQRIRVFGMFGIGASLGAVALTFAIGGDPYARAIFWAGISLLALSNVWLVWLTGSRERYAPGKVAAIWVISSFGLLPACYYFGPFSAVVIAPMLGVVFIALGRSLRGAVAVLVIIIIGHVAMAVPITFGWIVDRGVLPALVTSTSQLVLAEVLIVTFLISGFFLGRWARQTNANAITALANAVRLIGDQQQVLAEQDAEAAAARRAKEGRWTGHLMGGFKLGLVLGRGAMGDVYEGVGPGDVPAAVKLLNARSDGSDSLVERFHREMEVAARLESPHIVKVLGLSAPEAPVPFLAMERLVGTDLATKLRAQQRLPSDELVVLIDHVARGLEVARLAGVVHRDLKPHNLFLHEGTWKILDFGVSKLMDSEGTLTGEGGIVGTPQYMAPEQASGGQVTHLADVYALGAIAYRCLTGRSPFRGKDLAELVYQVVHVAPPRPSLLGRVPSAIEDALAVAMAKDPRRRFPSAMSFARAFVAARRGKPAAIDAPADAWT